VITPTQQLENYLESFSEFEKFTIGHALPWLRKLRRDAFARFCEVGFPTTHDEDWRFTNVSAIAQTSFGLARNGRARVSQQELEPYRVAGVACQLVFVNGRFARELSLPGKLPDEVKVSSLAGEISNNPRAIEPHLGRYLDIRRDAFCALNTAFLEDGAYVHILRGKLVGSPSACCLSRLGTMPHP
jgi:Fe-S cluster assembly protein SufD